MWLSNLLWGHGTALRNEQIRGSLEAVFLTPTSRLVALFAPPVSHLPFSIANFVVMGAVLWLAFGVVLPLGAALAIARKHVLTMSRYRVAMVSMVFIPLYQGVIPAFLFGAAFTIGGRSLGLASTIGTENLTGFIFLGGVISGMIATAFWGMA